MKHLTRLYLFLFLCSAFLLFSSLNPLANRAEAAILLDTTGGGIAGYSWGFTSVNSGAVTNFATGTYYLMFNATGTSWDTSGGGCGWIYTGSPSIFTAASGANWCLGIGANLLWFSTSTGYFASSTTDHDLHLTPNTLSGFLTGSSGYTPIPVHTIVYEYDGQSINNISALQFSGGGGGGDFAWAVNGSGQLYMRIATTLSEAFLGAAITPTISLDFPPDSSVREDFPSWTVSWLNLPSSTQGGAIGVCYGQSATDASNCLYDDAVDFSPTVNISPLDITKHQALWFPPLNNPATWYAFARVVSNTGAVVATSTQLTFYISAPTIAPPFSTTSTCAFTTSTSFTDDPLGVIQQGVCNTLMWVFVPSASQQVDLGDHFGVLTGHVSMKPPIGYFTLIKNDLTALQVGTSSIVLLDATATVAFSPIFTPLKTGLACLLWFLFGLWLFHRIRNFDFQQ